MDKQKYNLIKIVVSGPSNSGKSSILDRFVYNDFKKDYSYTVGVDFKYKIIKRKNITIKLHLWDTCGIKHFKDLIKLYYNDANVAIYIFDITDDQSASECSTYITDYCLKPDVKIYLIGNKTDLLNSKFKLNDKLVKLCQDKNIKYMECSAKTGENINNIFDEIISNFKFIENDPIDIGSLYYLKSKC